jgi:hypothetical protein
MIGYQEKNLVRGLIRDITNSTCVWYKAHVGSICNTVKHGVTCEWQHYSVYDGKTMMREVHLCIQVKIITKVIMSAKKSGSLYIYGIIPGILKLQNGGKMNGQVWRLKQCNGALLRYLQWFTVDNLIHSWPIWAFYLWKTSSFTHNFGLSLWAFFRVTDVLVFGKCHGDLAKIGFADENFLWTNFFSW